MLNNIIADPIIKAALREDLPYIDLSSDLLFENSHKSTAQLISKDEGILCGIEIFARTFNLIDDAVRCDIKMTDRDKFSNGDIICEINGPTKSILKAERVALNFLSHLTAVATKTANYCEIVRNTSAKIADTRKTIPGLRALQKYAVITGGGVNHRYNLSDTVMLKDNHIAAYGSIEKAMIAARTKIGHTTKIEVEVKNLNEVNQALACKADIIMLDNFIPELAKQAVDIICGKAIVEASGNITKENLLEYAKTGVDIISIGGLTHSLTTADFSLLVDVD